MTAEWKRIRIDWDELEEAFADSSTEHRYYLDRETGAVHFFSSYLDNAEEAEDERDLSTEDRYVLIPHARRLVPYRDLVEFVSSLEHEQDRNLLRSKLSRREGYHHFEEAIEGLPSTRNEWQRFVSERMESRIKDWLREVAVEPLE